MAHLECGMLHGLYLGHPGLGMHVVFTWVYAIIVLEGSF